MALDTATVKKLNALHRLLEMARVQADLLQEWPEMHEDDKVALVEISANARWARDKTAAIFRAKR